MENLIVHAVVADPAFARRVLPHLPHTAFDKIENQELYLIIKDYYIQYEKLPTWEVLKLEVEQKWKGDDTKKNLSIAVLEHIQDIHTQTIPDYDLEWLVDKTEAWAKNQILFNSMIQSVRIIKGEEKGDRSGIPSIIQKSLGFEFDTSIGHNYLEDCGERFYDYQNKEDRLPFGMKYFDLTTNGGIPLKTMWLWVADTGVGKTLTMCHFAAHWFNAGYNVLYVTAEMPERWIARRMDANLMRMNINHLEGVEKSKYFGNMKALYEDVHQRYGNYMYIKEYPTSSASAGDVRILLSELEMKKGFKPDVVMADYLGNFNPDRTYLQGEGGYSRGKAVAEEFRGLGGEFNTRIMTAHQLNREGGRISDPGKEHLADSYAIVQTADAACFLIYPKKNPVEKMNRYYVKMEKNRFNSRSEYPEFKIGVDYPEMRLYDVDDATSEDTNAMRFNKAPDFEGHVDGDPLKTLFTNTPADKS